MARAIVLLVLGAVLIVGSWGPLQNLFEENPDSPVSTYLLFGLPPLMLGLACVAAGVLYLRAR